MAREQYLLVIFPTLPPSLFFLLTFFPYCRLEFDKGPPAVPGGPPVATNEILAMLSPENERVPLQKVRTDF